MMPSVVAVLVIVTCMSQCTGVWSVISDRSEGETNGLDTILDATFSRLVEEARNNFRLPNDNQLNCVHAGGVADEAGGCRRFLKNEPGDALELLAFLLDDGEAMQLWRDHFRRHVKQVFRDVAPYDAADFPFQAPGLNILAEAEFWGSRPAVSKGALAHLRQKMDRLKLNAAALGKDPTHVVAWEAVVSPRFQFHSLKDATAIMGTYLTSYFDPDKVYVPLGNPLPPKVFSNTKPVETDNFDAREAFPDCKDVIGHVRDQGDCGSCWAFASTESLNDRLCIKTGGKRLEMLSPQHTTSCCDMIHCLSLGCNGGQPYMAWRWFSSKGVVSGGDYSELHEGKSCWPYEVPFCQHHSSGPYPECDETTSKTPKCRKECEEAKYTTLVRPFKKDLHFAVMPFSIDGRDNIKRELMESGSLTGAFLVFEDFLMYKSGVYHHVSGMPLGGHAIKVIGFGTELDKKYWLAVNSWNEYWGDNGTFKIEMGEGGIDDTFCGGEAKVPQDGMFRPHSAQDL